MPAPWRAGVAIWQRPVEDDGVMEDDGDGGCVRAGRCLPYPCRPAGWPTWEAELLV